MNRIHPHTAKAKKKFKIKIYKVYATRSIIVNIEI